MIHPNHLNTLIGKTLKQANLYSPEAVQLLLGTCAQESACGRYLHQLGNGPALGIFQMEPNTFIDIWENYLNYRSSTGQRIKNSSELTNVYPEQMVWNLKFAILMCRAHYLRVPASIPKTIEEQAQYWKKYYNTYLGSGTVEQYIQNYDRYIKT